MKLRKRYLVIFILWGLLFALTVYLKNIPTDEVEFPINQAFFNSDIVGNDNINIVKDNKLMVDIDIEKASVTSMPTFSTIDEISNIENIQ